MGFIKKSKKINYPKIKTQIFVTFEWTDYFSAKNDLVYLTIRCSCNAGIVS